MEIDAKNKIEMKSTNEFTEIVRLIEELRNRAFQKVNEELVLLYFTVWLEIHGTVQPSQIVSPTATQIKTDKQTNKPIVSDNKHSKFVSTVLTQITWSNHIEILSGSKTPEEKIIYLILTVKDKLISLTSKSITSKELTE